MLNIVFEVFEVHEKCQGPSYNNSFLKFPGNCCSGGCGSGCRVTVEMAAERQIASDGAVCAGETLSPVCEWMNVGRTEKHFEVSIYH